MDFFMDGSNCDDCQELVEVIVQFECYCIRQIVFLGYYKE